MYIVDDGIRLNATIDMPDGNPEKCPMVIIIHGFTGNSEERHILAVSRMFNEIGLATLRVDMYGHGKSDGQFCDHTLFKWMTNAMTVIDYALDLDFVTDLYLCGHSQGGLTVILAAALKHDKIRGLIPMSPANMIPEGARSGNLLGMTFDPENIPDEITEQNRRKSPDYRLFFRIIRKYVAHNDKKNTHGVIITSKESSAKNHNGPCQNLEKHADCFIQRIFFLIPGLLFDQVLVNSQCKGVP